MLHRPAEPSGVVRLDLSERDRRGRPDEALVGNLSVLALTGDCLWTASDETCALERLRTPDGGSTYGDHETFSLAELFDLPEGPRGEVDIEGLCADGDWLWVTGSMSLTRKKPKRLERDADEALGRLREVKREPNRWLLGRVPCVRGADDAFRLHRSVDLGGGGALEAACLKFNRRGNALSKALRHDEHIGRFLDVPAKENGFDVEGIAARGGRVFLGLRGPVLRGWAVVLELRVEPRPRGRLKLRAFGPGGAPYGKHFLDLDGLGVRDLKAHGDDLLVLSGPTMDLDGPVQLWRWPGAFAARGPGLVSRDMLELALDLPFDRGCDHAEGIALGRRPDGGTRLLVAYDRPAERRLGDGRGVDLDAFDLPPGAPVLARRRDRRGRRPDVAGARGPRGRRVVAPPPAARPRLGLGARPALARAHHPIPQGEGHTPVGVLARAHVMIVMPGHPAPRPRRVEVRPAVHIIIRPRAEPHRPHEPGRHPPERRDGRGVRDQPQHLAPRRTRAPKGLAVHRIGAPRAPRRAVVLVPMKRPIRALGPTQPVQHVLVHDPLARVRHQEPQRETQHRVPASSRPARKSDR